jgi:carbonic anhydrase/acetyltransferase-like protein (isoleucine patch superfamily)
MAAGSGGGHVIRSFRGKSPRIDPTAYVESSAHVIGDVVIGPRSSVWFNSVIRGDVHWIRIGSETNVQDLSVLHVLGGSFPLTLGDRVSVAHSVTLHGCRVGNGSLIGIGCVVMDNVEIGEDCLVAAGSLVTPGTKIPNRSLVMGSPAKVRREIGPAELEIIRRTPTNYVEYAKAYLVEATT